MKTVWTHFRPGTCGKALAVSCLCLAVICCAPRQGAPRQSETAIPGSLEIVAQLRAEQYEKLETLLSGLQRRYETGKVRESTVNAAFGAFTNSGADLEKKLNEWVLKFPGSFAARMARGRHFKALGAHARQEAYVQFTDPAQLGRMRAYFAQAAADLEAAIESSPQLTIAYADLMGIAMVTGADSALKELKARGLAIDPASSAIHYAYILSLRPQWGGSFAAMQSYLEELEAKHKKNPKMPKFKGALELARVRFLRNERQCDAAIKLLDKAIAELGPYSSFYRERGVCHSIQRRYGPALEDLNRALKIDPDDSEALTERAFVRFVRKRYEEALADIGAALRYDPRDARMRRFRAVIYRKMKNPSAALRDLRIAMEFGSFDSTIWEIAAKIYAFDLDAPDKAAEYMENLTLLRPNHPDVWLGYHSVAMDIGMHLYRKKRDCDGARVFMRFLNACRANAVCKSRLWYTAAPIMGSAAAETKCKSQSMPKGRDPMSDEGSQ